ncbi:hypothetical protein B0H13DRAFT_2333541 [Mycena leptocephala]|nr:hypothetical protein B0H13DRAFT_2333541 [Mycena leptocephala]
MYQSLFTVLLNQTLTSASIDFGAMNGSFFEPAAMKTNVSMRKTAADAEGKGPVEFVELDPRAPRNPLIPVENDCAELMMEPGKGIIVQDTRETLRTTRSGKRVEMEEIPDEDEEEWALKPKALAGILEPSQEEPEYATISTDEASPKKDWESRKRAREARKFNQMAEEFWLNDG